MNLSNEEKLVLQHIGRYTITLRRVLTDHLFGGQEPDYSLKKLIEGGYIHNPDGDEHQLKRKLPKSNISYYQLTPQGTQFVRVPKRRHEPLKEQALSRYLAVLWYCYMTDQYRERLEVGEMEKMVYEKLIENPTARLDSRQRDNSISNAGIVHCCDYDKRSRAKKTTPRVLRVKFNSGNTIEDDLIRDIEFTTGKAIKNKTVGWAVQEQLYGFVILTDSWERANKKSGLLKRMHEEGITERAYVTVRHAPKPDGVLEALKVYGRNPHLWKR